VQNPSVVLAFLAAALKRWFGYRLIADRHTNFFLGADPGPRVALFGFVSNYTLRAADLTIVTNEYLRQLVEEAGGCGLVLPDRIPDLRVSARRTLEGKHNVVVVSSFAPDEPVAAIAKAAALLPKDVTVYVTGNEERARKVQQSWPLNVRLTGYLEEQAFVDLIASCDVLVDLTDAEWCIVCGGHEAMALGIPLVTSRTIALSAYFSQGTVLTDNTAQGIAAAIAEALRRGPDLSTEMKCLRRTRAKEWVTMFHQLESALGTFDRDHRPASTVTDARSSVR